MLQPANDFDDVRHLAMHELVSVVVIAIEWRDAAVGDVARVLLKFSQPVHPPLVALLGRHSLFPPRILMTTTMMANTAPSRIVTPINAALPTSIQSKAFNVYTGSRRDSKGR